MKGFDRWAPLVVILLLLLSSRKSDSVDPIRPVDPIQGAWVVVVEETSERTPETTAIVTNAAYWQSLRDKGLNWIIYDKDQEEAASQVKALGGQVPGILIQTPGERSKVLYQGKLPASTEEIDRLTKRYAGL
jgi:hypothetical protein